MQQGRTRSPGRMGSPSTNQRRSRGRPFHTTQKNMWRDVKTRRERSPGFRARAGYTMVGKYRIEDTVVGKGAWSVVKPAIDVQTNREFVAKIVRKQDLHKTCPGGEDEVHREVRVLQHLPRNKHIVEFIELIDQPSEYYVILESLSNGDLCDAILDSPDNKVPEDRARRFFAMMTQSLLCCHRHGVTHRDIKPENMLLNEKQHLKLTDFGLARMHNTSFRCDPSDRSSNLVGTLRYAAPELFEGHFRGIEYDDFIADVWSLGVCLYVMLTGIFPFSTGPDMDEANNRDLMNTRELLMSTEPEYPVDSCPQASHLMKRLLEKDPEKRIDLREVMDHPWLAGIVPRNPDPFFSNELEQKLEEQAALLEVRERELAEKTREIAELKQKVAALEGRLRARDDSTRTLDLDTSSNHLGSINSPSAGTSPLQINSTSFYDGHADSAAKLSMDGSTVLNGTDYSTVESLRHRNEELLALNRDLEEQLARAKSRSATPTAPTRNITSRKTHSDGSMRASTPSPNTMARRGIRCTSPSHTPSAGSWSNRSDDAVYCSPTTVGPKVTALGKPQVRSISPRPTGKPSGRNSPVRPLTSSARTDSPGINPRNSAPRSLTKPPGSSLRNTTPTRHSDPKKPSTPTRTRIGTNSPSRTPPALSRGSVQVPASGSASKPKPSFAVGDHVIYTSRDDGAQSEAVVHFYGRTNIEDGGCTMLGIELLPDRKGNKGVVKGKHDGKGYFVCPPSAGLLVFPKDCRPL